jgi:hypothetical protein
LFWYKGEIHDDFRVGKRQMWEFHYKMKKIKDDEDREYDEDYVEKLYGTRHDLGRNATVFKLNTNARLK